jgi:hypothetical protein
MALIDATGLGQYERRGTWSGWPAFLHARHWDDGRLLMWPLLGYGIVLAAAWTHSSRRLRRGPLAGLEAADVTAVFLRSTANARFWARPIYADLVASPARLAATARSTAAAPTAAHEGVTATRTTTGATPSASPRDGTVGSG